MLPVIDSKLPSTGAKSVAYDFTGKGGSGYPDDLVSDGTILYGFAFGSGFFSFDPSSATFKVLYPDSPQGLVPTLSYAGGALYGENPFGGSSSNGYVFGLDVASGVFTTLYSFPGGAGGTDPVSELTLDNGKLYGSTAQGGTNNNGVLFSVDARKGGATILYAGFSASPVYGFALHTGKLYGVLPSGGKSMRGSVYSFDISTGVEKSIYDFSALKNGHSPRGAVTYYKGKLYGATKQGGKFGVGTIFKVDISTGVETVLHSFTGAADGSYPLGSLVSFNGALYGATLKGGALNCNIRSNEGCGTVFKLVP